MLRADDISLTICLHVLAVLPTKHYMKTLKGLDPVTIYKGGSRLHALIYDLTRIKESSSEESHGVLNY